MTTLTDLAICTKIAEIEGVKFLTGEGEHRDKIYHIWQHSERYGILLQHVYNPLTDYALCFQLMVKYEVSVDRYTDSVYIESDYTDKPHKSHVSFAIDSVSINKAILLSIIEANKES